MNDFCIAAFQCAADAILAQKELQARKLPAAMMPTPRELTESCGLSLRFGPTEAGEIMSALDQVFLSHDRCQYFQVHLGSGARSVSPIGRTRQIQEDRSSPSQLSEQGDQKSCL